MIAWRKICRLRVPNRSQGRRYAMIYALGDISGAHLNPAVTFGFFAAGRLELRMVLPYMLSQIAGALTASGVLKILFPQHPTLGSTLPAGSDLQSLVLELILTGILMFVILSVSTGAKEKGIPAGIAVGAVVGLEALFAGPISGASTVRCVGNSRRNRMLVRKCRRTRTAFFDR